MTRIFACQGEDGRALDWPLLRRAAALTWGWEDLPAVERSPRGKPFFPSAPERWFSLSHSGGYALCALSDEGAVGADIEVVQPRRAKLLDRVLTPAERLACRDDWGEFTRIWTLKESLCKLEDSPLYPPSRLVTPPPCPHKSWAGEGWRASVCCAGAPPEDVEWLEDVTPVSP